MKFVKMHGIGNDYVYIDCFKENVSQDINDIAKLAIRVSDRHKGIGSDGLVLIMPSEKADVRMRMFNSDGSEAQMCGNAIRCVGKYVYDSGIITKDKIDVETLAGTKYLSFNIENDRVTTVAVDMGAPEWRSKYIPTANDNEESMDVEIDVNGTKYTVSCVSFGNPHAVIYVDDVNTTDVWGIGKLIEHHPFFPEKVNVEFIQVIDKNTLKMRVWERGAGETQACGTGACAAATVSMKKGLVSDTVEVQLLGGSLEIKWENKSTVIMTGEAVTVFTGELV